MSSSTVAFDQRAATAAVEVLERLLEAIEANLEGAIDGRDPECLHDFRVAVRRSRAVQRELKRVFPRKPLAHFRKELRWLQTVTGPARDLDVYVAGFDSLRELLPLGMGDDLEPLLELLEERRLSARVEMAAALRSLRAADALAGWRVLLSELEQEPDRGRRDASRPIGKVAGKRIRKVYKRMVRIGRPIRPSSPSEAFHELRKQGKELRYLLELFGSHLYPTEVVKPMIKSLKALQDVLGRHQDRQVQILLLRELGDELAARPGGAAALTAVAALIVRLEEDQLAARKQFAKRFGAFASEHQRALVKQTFA